MFNTHSITTDTTNTSTRVRLAQAAALGSLIVGAAACSANAAADESASPEAEFARDVTTAQPAAAPQEVVDSASAPIVDSASTATPDLDADSTGTAVDFPIVEFEDPDHSFPYFPECPDLIVEDPTALENMVLTADCTLVDWAVVGPVAEADDGDPFHTPDLDGAALGD